MLAEALMAGKAHMFLNKSVPDEQPAAPLVSGTGTHLWPLLQ